MSYRPVTPLVEATHIYKHYESPSGVVPVLKDVNIHVMAGEFVCVLGPSGSGKSTLINLLTGIDRPSRGSIRIVGQEIQKMGESQLARFRGEHIGIIFQFFQLLPTLTVLENIILPMNLCRKWQRNERRERAMLLLKQVGLEEHAHKLPAMLSGGQQQRAAIARALANDPPVLVGDEPTGSLDSRSAQMIFDLFQSLVSLGKTFIMVTHDTALANRIPHVIQVNDGVVVQNRNRFTPAAPVLLAHYQEPELAEETRMSASLSNYIAQVNAASSAETWWQPVFESDDDQTRAMRYPPIPPNV